MLESQPVYWERPEKQPESVRCSKIAEHQSFQTVHLVENISNLIRAVTDVLITQRMIGDRTHTLHLLQMQGFKQRRCVGKLRNFGQFENRPSWSTVVKQTRHGPSWLLQNTACKAICCAKCRPLYTLRAVLNSGLCRRWRRRHDTWLEKINDFGHLCKCFRPIFFV